MIGRQVAVGSLVLVGVRLLTRLLDLAAMLLLARLLLPADFGIVAIAMTLVSLVETVLEMPIGEALLRLPVITPRHYDTAFTLTALRGLTLTVIMLACAWPFARFYGDDRLVWLVCVLGIAPAVRGMPSPRMISFHKQLSFWRDFVVELTGKLIAFAVAITLAVITGSYWSLAVGTVLYPLAMAVGSYVLAPYRPRFSLAERSAFSGFVGWMSAAQLVTALNWQSERLLLGKLQTASSLGLFTTASDLASIPSQALFSPIARPLMTAFSHLIDQPAKLAASYLSASTAILAIGVPLLVGESLVAAPVVQLVLGAKWTGAIPLLHWLALSIIPSLFSLPVIPLIMASGKTAIVLRRNVIEMGVKLPLLVVGVWYFGFWGVVVSRFASETVAAVLYMRFVRGLLGLSIGAQLRSSWRIAVSTLAMVVPVVAGFRYLPPPDAPWQAALRLGVIVLAGMVTYVGALSVLWTLVGRPAGLEAMAIGAFGRLSGRFR